MDSKESIPPAYVASAGTFKQSMGARNRVGIGLSYWSARLHRMAELVHWKRFLGSLKVHKIENFFASYYGICVISLLVMYK